MRRFVLAAWVGTACTATGGSGPIDVAITPDMPTTVDRLVVVAPDAPSDAIVTWYRDGGEVAGGFEVGAGHTTRGQVWRAELEDAYGPIGQAEVEIANAAPELSVALPIAAPAGSDLVAQAQGQDADGDELTWSFTWSVDGVVQDDLETALVPGARTQEGERWSVSVSASDGLLDSVADTETVLSAPVIEVPDVEGPDTRGDWLFDDHVTREIFITITDDAFASLLEAPFQWVEGRVEVDGQVVERAGIRLKGNGSFLPIDEKPSLKIELDKWVDNQELDGLDEFVLNNMSTDASMVSERVAYEAYRRMDIAAPRASHCLVWINQARYGLYILVEEVDGRFLSRWFEDGNGPLYEMFDVDMVPEDVYQFDHDGGPDDRTALWGLSRVLVDPDSQLSVDAAPFLDLEQFVDYFGMSAVIGQFDAFPYTVPGDDVYLYVDPTDGRMRFIPHGGDEAFRDARRPVDYVFGLLAIRCLDDGWCRDAFVASTWEALAIADDTELLRWANDEMDRTAADAARETRAPYDLDAVLADQAVIDDFMRHREDWLLAMPGLR